MSPENYGFCPHCGANVPENASFCPECGTNLGPAPDSGNGAAQSGHVVSPLSPDSPMQGTFLFAFIMIIIYSVFAIVGGISLLLGTDAMLNTLDETFIREYGKTFEQYMADSGFHITMAELKNVLILSGISSLVSGLFSAAAAVLCQMRSRCTIATVLLVISSLVTLVTGVGAIIDVVFGLLMAYFVYKARPQFRD